MKKPGFCPECGKFISDKFHAHKLPDRKEYTESDEFHKAPNPLPAARKIRGLSLPKRERISEILAYLSSL